jgi:hypothetical protein
LTKEGRRLPGARPAFGVAGEVIDLPALPPDIFLEGLAPSNPALTSVPKRMVWVDSERDGWRDSKVGSGVLRALASLIRRSTDPVCLAASVDGGAAR